METPDWGNGPYGSVWAEVGSMLVYWFLFMAAVGLVAWIIASL